ncbi:MAG: type II toxin-antitoxin system HicB family antitoxin [Deltaproteobacteria bacterium]|nr:type II toxin-antitoxin system HicB family antitoxin [Deltaproteobacteria bacterium]
MDKTEFSAYFAVFTTTPESVKVVFPDLLGLETVGENFDDAYKLAVEVLSEWLATTKESGLLPKSTFEDLSNQYSGLIVPVPVDPKMMKKHEKKTRVNISLSTKTLRIIDDYALNQGMNRSEFLEKAALSLIGQK